MMSKWILIGCKQSRCASNGAKRMQRRPNWPLPCSTSIPYNIYCKAVAPLFVNSGQCHKNAALESYDAPMSDRGRSSISALVLYLALQCH